MAKEASEVKETLNGEDLFRLHWTLDGPLETAISVMPNAYYDPDELESARSPYARAASDGGAPTLHPISPETITNPPVSTLTVSVSELNQWEDNWLMVHECHSDPDKDPEGNWGPAPAGADADASAGDSESNDKLHLLRCCGEERPWDPDNASLTVQPSGDMITIHDFVSQVHPWLMGMRRDLVQAAAYTYAQGEALPPDTQLLVVPHLGSVSVLPKDEWAKEHRDRELGTPLMMPISHCPHRHRLTER